jgi:hypothetical protein
VEPLDLLEQVEPLDHPVLPVLMVLV